MRYKGEFIGRGRTAEVYAWGAGQALKLYRAGLPQELAEAEYQTASVISQAWESAPAVHGMAQVDGRYGIVYEHVRGPSLLQAVMARPWILLRAAHLMAELQVRMHATRIAGLPSQAERLRLNIQAARPLPGALKTAALAALSWLPTDGALCHGDFHLDNIVLSARGPIVLDWLDATSGHPLADVARTSLLMQYAVLPPGLSRRRLIEAVRTLWYRLYFRRYCQLTSNTYQQVAKWLLPVAPGRLNEDIPEEVHQLLACVGRLAA